MRRIRKLSTIAIIVMLPMMFYYPYHALSWSLELSFLDMGKWTRNDRWVDRDAQIAMTTRIVFFTMWAVPVVLGFVGYVAGFWALLFLRKGIVFDVRISRRLTIMGLMIFSSSTLALLAGALSPMVRSWHNADGPLPLRFWYNSGNIGLAFCGLAFLFLGLVMREAIRIARENEEFI
jgi:hypothetical protein|tara:strand:+ start:664 stop:1194 length:531 start_codon:yes stop_codon:yes gene_type:complete